MDGEMVHATPANPRSTLQTVSGKRSGARRCAGTATSDYPQGPYAVTEQPLICDDAGGGVIDPVQFDDGTTRWILWKVDGNALGGKTTCTGSGGGSGDYKPTPIRIQKVTRDGLTLQGSPKTIFDHNGAGDDGVVEGPAMWKRRPGSYVSCSALLCSLKGVSPPLPYFCRTWIYIFSLPTSTTDPMRRTRAQVLFFSTHCYSSDSYDIQYAWGTSPDASFGHRQTLAKSGPNQPVYGPGHMDIASDGATIAFHGRDKPGNPSDTKRRMYVGKIRFPEGDYSEGIKVVNYQG